MDRHWTLLAAHVRTGHGSTRYLWTTEAISTAVHYVCEEGEPMAVLEALVAR